MLPSTASLLRCNYKVLRKLDFSEFLDYFEAQVTLIVVAQTLQIWTFFFHEKIK